MSRRSIASDGTDAWNALRSVESGELDHVLFAVVASAGISRAVFSECPGTRNIGSAFQLRCHDAKGRGCNPKIATPTDILSALRDRVVGDVRPLQFREAKLRVRVHRTADECSIADLKWADVLDRELGSAIRREVVTGPRYTVYCPASRKRRPRARQRLTTETEIHLESRMVRIRRIKGERVHNGRRLHQIRD